MKEKKNIPVTVAHVLAKKLEKFYVLLEGENEEDLNQKVVKEFKKDMTVFLSAWFGKLEDYSVEFDYQDSSFKTLIFKIHYSTEKNIDQIFKNLCVMDLHVTSTFLGSKARLYNSGSVFTEEQRLQFESAFEEILDSEFDLDIWLQFSSFLNLISNIDVSKETK